MNAFELHQPKDLASAATLAAGGGDLRFLAGGQSILASMKLGLASPDAMIDLSLIPDMKAITVGGGVVKIGAMAKHADVAANAEVKKAIPYLIRRSEENTSINGQINDELRRLKTEILRRKTK